MPTPSTIISKLKVHLKMSIQRLRMTQQKDEAIAKQQRRAMAQLLETGKYESARIRVENIIRSDLTNELHEILELYCELLLARINLLDPTHASSGVTSTYSTQYIDPGLEEAIIALVHAAPRTEIKELQSVRSLLVEKFGREFALKCGDDPDGKVPERVRRKLRVEPPSSELVESYLQAIAAAYDVPYGDQSQSAPANDDDDDDGGEGGGSGVAESVETPKKSLAPPLEAKEQSLKEATPPPDRAPGALKSPVSVAPPSPRTEDPSPKVKLPGPPELKPGPKMQGRAPTAATATPKATGGSGLNKPKGDIPDVDDLEKRFAMLKR